MHILFSRRTKSSNPSNVPLKQGGQSAVEIALLLPLLLMLLFGVIIVAFNFFAFIQVSNAAREGARVGSLYRITNPKPNPANVPTLVQQTVNGALGTLPVSTSVLKVKTVTSNPTDPSPGDKLTVTVTYSYTMPIVATALPMFPQPIVFVRTVIMEVQ